MNGWELAIFGLAGFLMAILSGIAGAGGGFVMTPLGIFLGLTPAQSISTGKFSGLSVTVGSLIGMRAAHGRISWARILPIMLLAFVIGLGVPHVIRVLDSEVYRNVLGVILLLMIPIMIFKKMGIKPHSPSMPEKVAGGFLLTVSLVLQGVFSGGLGSLVNIVLMSMLGMTAIEANITKRWSQVILNTTIIFGVIGSGFVIWSAAAVGVATTFTGSYIGGRLAVKKGDQFVVHIMIGLMFISALALILG